jgi:hypothetical protein
VKVVLVDRQAIILVLAVRAAHQPEQAMLEVLMVEAAAAAFHLVVKLTMVVLELLVQLLLFGKILNFLLL